MEAKESGLKGLEYNFYLLQVSAAAHDAGTLDSSEDIPKVIKKAHSRCSLLIYG